MPKNENKKLLTLILARKGSQRIKNKNLRKIGKYSLSEITIKFALKLKLYSDIIVSTDDRRVIQVANKYNVKIPGIRPKNLSRGKSLSLDVVKYLINWYENKYQTKVEGIILLQPTSPFRKISLIIDTIKKFKKTKFNYVSISKDKDFNNNYLHLDAKNFLRFPNRNNISNCRENGNFYIFNSKKINSDTIKSITNSKSKGILINSKKLSLDIDTFTDLKKARKYHELLK